jgi:hypothetical protein
MADPRVEAIDRYFVNSNDKLFGEYDQKIGQVIVEKAAKYGLRISTVAAFVEKESNGRNVFGCDLGSRNSAPWCNHRVTRARLDALIAWVNRGGASNGVGYGQLTYLPFIRMAEERGGAYLPGPNIDVAAEEIKRLMVRYDDGTRQGWINAAAAYNGGESGRFLAVTQAYGRDVAAKADAWWNRLGLGDDTGVKEPVNKGVMENVRTVKTYGLNLLNGHHPKYWCWDGGNLNVPRPGVGRPACVDGPPPPMPRIDKMFCADLISLQLRRLGKPVPKNRFGNENYDGGTRSFKLRYGSVMRPFRLSELQEGDVPFVDFNTPWAREGHIGFCLGDGPNARILQSFAFSCATLEPGLNADYTVAESHDGGYYTHYIPREAIWG